MSRFVAAANPLFVAFLGFLSACPPGGEVSRPPEVVPPSPPEVRPVTVGRFADCTPSGFSDVVCDTGLHCAIVRVGDAPSFGYVSKCVPNADKPLKLGEACQFDQAGPAGPSGSGLQFDSCATGLSCVEGSCRKLCALRERGSCGDELCVLPTRVSGTGFCAPSDKCQAVFPQSPCGRDAEGNTRNCYVLTDDKGGGTFCLKQEPYGDSTGLLDSPCERSANCQAGLACTVTGRMGRDAVCRPYCALPEVPDGGMAPEVKCTMPLGTCHAIANYETYGRCY